MEPMTPASSHGCRLSLYSLPPYRKPLIPKLEGCTWTPAVCGKIAFYRFLPTFGGPGSSDLLAAYISAWVLRMRVPEWFWLGFGKPLRNILLDHESTHV